MPPPPSHDSTGKAELRPFLPAIGALEPYYRNLLRWRSDDPRLGVIPMVKTGGERAPSLPPLAITIMASVTTFIISIRIINR